jgi:hypothetical protein
MILRRLRYHLLYSCTRTMQSQIDVAVGRQPLSTLQTRVSCRVRPVPTWHSHSPTRAVRPIDMPSNEYWPSDPVQPEAGSVVDVLYRVHGKPA